MKIKSILALLTTAFMTGSFAGAAESGVPKTYPLKKCVVSDETLGAHGKSFKATTSDGTEVYLCCKGCLKDLKKDEAKFAKMVKDAEAKK